MTAEATEKPVKRHVGRNVQRIRVHFGVKQEVLAADLGMSQQSVSKMEQQEEIDDDLLSKIANALGISAEVIKDFDLERAIYNINSNNYKDATISEGAIANAIAQQIHPIEKIVELYERLLKSEKEKLEILLSNKR
jgi:transcriptional regulator with XRE-family HTH domain